MNGTSIIVFAGIVYYSKRARALTAQISRLVLIARIYTTAWRCKKSLAPMHSTTANRWLVEDSDDDPPDAMEYICIATDLLQQMFPALRSRAKNHPDLAREMSSRDSVMRHRLSTLHGTVGVRFCSGRPTSARNVVSLIYG
jgi:hypothetical protein